MIAFAPVELKEAAPVFDNLPTASPHETPPTMEACDEGYGCLLYRTKIPAGSAATLEAAAIHDFGQVFLDGKRVGILDRRSRAAKILLRARASESRLDILVEPMGRINFGPEMCDHKGLIAPVNLGGEILKGWEVFKLPLGDKAPAGLKFTRAKPGTNVPAFWRGTFRLKKAGDTFLNLRDWGKGDLWVNGHCLGRYWNVGPTQTAYAPGCWLRDAKNEIIILDLVGRNNQDGPPPEVEGLDKPILDELHPEKDFTKTLQPEGKSS